jgi:RNA polymerase sigma-70 factor, ECF subfamily
MADRILERVARESYGKLMAILAARSRDIAAAEDALSEAFAAALASWPRTGAPDNPEAWLLATARRKRIDQARRAATAAAAQPHLTLQIEELDAAMAEFVDMPDRRLGLMFACAHPALEPGVRTALMLQTVLGLSAERIAAGFLVAPAAMGQRLVRAKAKIAASGAPFVLPPRSDWPARMPAVLDAVYAAFTAGWDGGGDLAEEAIWLGRLLATAAPDEPEAQGLIALMLHAHARRPARRDAEGRYAPLAEQDIRLWRRDLQFEAEIHLRRAAAFAQPGRFQLEAAIQSAHAARAFSGRVDWAAIAALYDRLATLTGSDIARLNRAAALAHLDGPASALEEVERLALALSGYQPFWALKAHLLSECGRSEQARAAYDRAIAGTQDADLIAFLSARRARLAP